MCKIVPSKLKNMEFGIFTFIKSPPVYKARNFESLYSRPRYSLYSLALFPGRWPLNKARL